MYKVMLVDDEILILDGLKELIDWETLGLEIVNTSLNGEEALKEFTEVNPDIVITDISMPKMNGLMLIKEIKAISDRTRFIILSGYDEFNYAKEAIRLGIENYILKPINEEELEATLKNTIEKLKLSSKLPVLEKKKIEILKENILYRWVTNNISSYELKEREFVLDIKLGLSFYMAGIINLKKCDNHKTYEIYLAIKDLAEKMLDCSVFRDLDNNIVIIYGSNDYETINKDFQDMIESVETILEEKYSIFYFITLGSIENGHENAHKSYQTASKIQDYLLIYGYNKIITYDMFSSMEGFIEDSQLDAKEFNKVFLSKDLESVETYIGKIFDNLTTQARITPEGIYDIAIKMIFLITQLSDELKLPGWDKKENVKSLITEVLSFKTTEEIKEVVLLKSREFINLVNEEQSSISPIVQQVISHIDKHYGEELSLKTLAQKYNINPSYLGQVFNKEIGESFSDYLNKIRNEKAKELLLNTNLKVNEIAVKVGYIDTSYFYRKFRDYFGISPNTMRSSKNYKL
ncbi:response regulator transcription factor [Clostridium swellfunianum]|uniref:response regulator transcription factor n=1 Tax=Clostridium swellfunianum TaxID=1367462 RepID=UPI00202EAA63|nr:response regulator transcription factor [Clostridium swellfunianum]MCM0647326.1 response regulator transcription factor [Clostridium swellfunianum]